MQDQPAQKKRKVRDVPASVVAGIIVVLLAAGGGTALWGWYRLTSLTTPPVPNTEQNTDTGQMANEESVQIYWLGTTGNTIELIPRPVTVEKTAEPQQRLENAFKRLLAGPNDSNLTSTIPSGTQLLGLSLENNGVHVNLSEEFTQGGGSASMSGRLAQVLYTATSLDPEAPVWISVEGEPLEVLGGEGLLVDQPMTRQDFESNFEL